MTKTTKLILLESVLLPLGFSLFAAIVGTVLSYLHVVLGYSWPAVIASYALLDLIFIVLWGHYVGLAIQYESMR